MGGEALLLAGALAILTIMRYCWPTMPAFTGPLAIPLLIAFKPLIHRFVEFYAFLMRRLGGLY